MAHSRKIKKKLLPVSLFLMGCWAFAGSVQAAAITNLSDERQVVDIESAQGYLPQEIQAGRTYRTVGNIRVLFNGKITYIEAHKEYAIWKDGSLQPQKTTHLGHIRR